MKIAVIGAGSWGTALAGMLGEKYADVWLWARDCLLVEQINSQHCNEKYLPEIELPKKLRCTSDLERAVTFADIVIIAAPSHVFRETAQNIAQVSSGREIFITVAKGFEPATLERMSEVAAAELSVSREQIVALSGPNHAEEVGRKYPTATVAAGISVNTIKFVQDVLTMPYFRVYTNHDIIGVELGGALKNIIAVGTGIVEGLGFGDNTKAALITRGIVEITRLGIAMEAKPSTFSGLAGIGDLVATCTGKYSRNRQAGIQFAQGYSLEAVQDKTSMVVEGIKATLAACRLSKKYSVEMPITSQIYEVIYNNKNPKQAFLELMSRGQSHEEGVLCSATREL